MNREIQVLLGPPPFLPLAIGETIVAFPLVKVFFFSQVVLEDFTATFVDLLWVTRSEFLFFHGLILTFLAEYVKGFPLIEPC